MLSKFNIFLEVLAKEVKNEKYTCWEGIGNISIIALILKI
jgi:hypothetical protein